MIEITPEEKIVIEPLVQQYIRNRSMVEAIARVLFSTIEESLELRPLIHSVKYRSKDPQHLGDKLARKMRAARSEGRAFEINSGNLYQQINDLAGVRVLHLHTSQITAIDPPLTRCLEEKNFLKKQGPVVKTWDDEYRRFFEAIPFETEASKNQYTSVHYVFDSQNDLGLTAEVQVRTLAEEIWGEVDHILNYPHKHSSLACKEQIAVLARVTSSCTRLVDAIFRSDEEHQDILKRNASKQRRATSKTPTP